MLRAIFLYVQSGSNKFFLKEPSNLGNAFVLINIRALLRRRLSILPIVIPRDQTKGDSNQCDQMMMDEKVLNFVPKLLGK